MCVIAVSFQCHSSPTHMPPCFTHRTRADPLPVLPLPSDEIGNLRFHLAIEGNSFNGNLSRLSGPALEILLADDNMIQGSINELNASANLKMLSVAGNRLTDHPSLCLSDAFTNMLQMERYDISDNLLDHARPCNVLSSGAPATFLQGVVSLPEAITQFCGSCSLQRIASNCAQSACIDKAKQQSFRTMVAEAIAKATDYSSIDPGAVELLRLEGRGSVGNHTTYATFRVRWTGSATTLPELSSEDVLEVTRMLVDNGANGTVADVRAVCTTGLLGESCRYTGVPLPLDFVIGDLSNAHSLIRYTAQLNWRPFNPALKQKASYNPGQRRLQAVVSESDLDTVLVQELPSKDELLEDHFPTEEVFPSKVCKSECVGKMAAAFRDCRKSIEAFALDPTSALTHACGCFDKMEVAEEACPQTCFSSTLLGFRQLLQQVWMDLKHALKHALHICGVQRGRVKCGCDSVIRTMAMRVCV